VLGDLLRRSDAHLCRLKGLQTIPHGPLEDLLHLAAILVDVEVAPAVSVPVLEARKQATEMFFTDNNIKLIRNTLSP